MPSGISGSDLSQSSEQVSSFTSTWLPQVQRYRFDLPSFVGTIPTIAMRPPQTEQLNESSFMHLPISIITTTSTPLHFA
jgi:hypothetical protein